MARSRPSCRSAIVGLAAAALLGAAASAGTAAAHTDADLVAVPAGAAATVTLKPTHGCGDSPTVAVSTRVPVAGARPGDVAGWTATAEDDGDGRTVVEWSGSSLAADEVGTFPVTFTAPDSAGQLLLFPFVQVCANGEELAWIDGDPGGEYPAPRLLVLPAGAEPAATPDDVPDDAPGRDQLTEIVDVDNPVVGPDTSAAPDDDPDAEDPIVAAGDSDDDDGDAPWLLLAGAGLVVVGAAILGVLRLRRSP